MNGETGRKNERVTVTIKAPEGWGVRVVEKSGKADTGSNCVFDIYVYPDIADGDVEFPAGLDGHSDAASSTEINPVLDGK